MNFFKSPLNCAHWYGGAVIDLGILNKIDLFNGSVSIHHQNIGKPGIEMSKTLKGVVTEFLKGIFKLQTNCLTNK